VFYKQSNQHSLEDNMQPKNKKILIWVVAGVAVIAALALAFFLGRGTSSDDNDTTATSSTTSTARTATTPQAPTVTVTVPSQPSTAPSSSGPYSSMGAAVSYVEAKDMQVLDPGSTWQNGDTLHVIHATPLDSASYGGDFYYFFVDGYQVAEEVFTSAVSSQTIDSTTFAVTFNVYLSTDPHCCPSGGASTVQFHWDGGNLVTNGSMQGATM
jgi:hypothetical protein